VHDDDDEVLRDVLGGDSDEESIIGSSKKLNTAGVVAVDDVKNVNNDGEEEDENAVKPKNLMIESEIYHVQGATSEYRCVRVCVCICICANLFVAE
jgi:hypothetical protein